MITNKEIIKAKGETLAWLGKKINKTIDEAFDLICDIVRENGGLVKTASCFDKPTLYAYYGDSVFGSHEYCESIHGLRWDDELGLCICTDSMLQNYTYDTDYGFENFADFEGEDLENLEKALADPAYFVEFESYNLNRIETILNLITGLPAYL